MLWSWLSFDDCVRLVSSALTAPYMGFTITAGMSDNKVKPVDNSPAGHLGYVPQDSSEPYREKVEGSTVPLGPNSPAVRYLGGWFTELGHPDDEENK